MLMPKSFHLLTPLIVKELKYDNYYYFQNSVTILDVSSKQLFGPAYSGHMLGSLQCTPQHMPSDQSLLLFLQTIAASLNEKLFMYQTLMKMKPLSRKTRSRHSHDILRDIGLDGCDAEIVRHLSKVGSIDWRPLQQDIGWVFFWFCFVSYTCLSLFEHVFYIIFMLSNIPYLRTTPCVQSICSML